MTEQELVELDMPDRNMYNGAPWRLFVKFMADKSFGYDAACEAWTWFLAGYRAHIQGPR